MEKKQTKKQALRINDWVNSLGFRLPSGSTLSADDFRTLLATPNRKRLWEQCLKNSVQPRKVIEFKRKGILAYRLQGGSLGKQDIVPELKLWEKQKNLEAHVTEKRNDVSELEKGVLTKSCDLLLEICKLAEFEKQSEEYKEKMLILKLCTQRQNKMKAKLKSIMESSELDFLVHCYQMVDSLKEEISNTNQQHSKVLELNNSNRKEENPWEEFINSKINLHKQFQNFVEEIKSNEKRNPSKMLQIEENLKLALIKLKQMMTEKALQSMVNTKEGKTLNLKIQELMNKSESIYQDESFGSSFLTPAKDKEKQLEMFTKNAKVLGLQSYRDFLQEELMKLDEKESQEFQGGREKFQLKMKTLNAVINDIHKLKLQREELSNHIMIRHDELQMLLKAMGEENKEDAWNKSVDETVTNLKATFEKQIEIFMETPFDAFRKVETSSGRIVFECESLNHCLNNYGGEFKDFFTAMLIPPTKNVSKIMAELEKRKKIVREAMEFISNSEKLIQQQKNILHSLNSIKTESKICEENFQDARGILWQISNKLKESYPKINLVKKILKNWEKQPYRLMIKETYTVNGLTLKQYEEIYSKENKR